MRMTKQEEEEQKIYENGYNAAFDEIEEKLNSEARHVSHELEQGYPKDVLDILELKSGYLESLRKILLNES